MAEEYVIRVTADGSVQDKEKPIAMPNGGGSNTGGAIPTAENGSPYIKSAKLVAAGAMVPAVKAIASTSVSMIGISTGNNKLQQKMNIAASMYGKASGAFQGAVAGFALAGPVGAVAAVASSAITEATQMASTAMRLNIEYRNEQERLGVMQDRAGLTTNRRRR